MPSLILDDNIVLCSRDKSLIIKNTPSINSSLSEFIQLAESSTPTIPVIYDTSSNLLKIPISHPFSRNLQISDAQHFCETAGRSRKFCDMKNSINHLHRYNTIKTRSPEEEISLWHRIMGHCDLDTLINLTLNSEKIL